MQFATSIYALFIWPKRPTFSRFARTEIRAYFVLAVTVFTSQTEERARHSLISTNGQKDAFILEETVRYRRYTLTKARQ